jgi:hypothetical protein
VNQDPPSCCCLSSGVPSSQNLKFGFNVIGKQLLLKAGSFSCHCTHFTPGLG